jgi:hypothetical protein
MSIKYWNSRLNARGSKIFIVALHPSTVNNIDWLKVIRKKRDTVA